MFYSQVKDPLLLLRRLPLFKTYSVHASVKQQQQLKQPLSRVLNTRWNSCWNCRERIFRSDKQPSLHRKVIIANSTLAVVVQHVDSSESLGVMNGRIPKRHGQMIIAQGNDLHVHVIVIDDVFIFQRCMNRGVREFLDYCYSFIVKKSGPLNICIENRCSSMQPMN